MQIPITSCLNITPTFAFYVPFRKMLYVIRSSVPNATNAGAVIIIIIIIYKIKKHTHTYIHTCIHTRRRSTDSDPSYAVYI